MTLDTLPNGDYSGPITPKGPASSGCVVQKFGGTSVGKFALEIVANVIKPSLVKDHVAVVCSAISATVKADGTTNRWVSRLAFWKRARLIVIQITAGLEKSAGRWIAQLS